MFFNNTKEEIERKSFIINIETQEIIKDFYNNDVSSFLKNNGITNEENICEDKETATIYFTMLERDLFFDNNNKFFRSTIYFANDFGTDSRNCDIVFKLKECEDIQEKIVQEKIMENSLYSNNDEKYYLLSLRLKINNKKNKNNENFIIIQQKLPESIFYNYNSQKDFKKDTSWKYCKDYSEMINREIYFFKYFKLSIYKI